MAADDTHVVAVQPHGESYRRVSIVEGIHGHDNPAFDSPRSRKVSATSDYAEIGPVRKKSILHHAHNLDHLAVPSTLHHHDGKFIE